MHLTYDSNNNYFWKKGITKNIECKFLVIVSILGVSMDFPRILKKSSHFYAGCFKSNICWKLRFAPVHFVDYTSSRVFISFFNEALDNIDCVFSKLKHRTYDRWLYHVIKLKMKRKKKNWTTFLLMKNEIDKKPCSNNFYVHTKLKKKNNKDCFLRRKMCTFWFHSKR